MHKELSLSSCKICVEQTVCCLSIDDCVKRFPVDIRRAIVVWSSRRRKKSLTFIRKCTFSEAQTNVITAVVEGLLEEMLEDQVLLSVQALQLLNFVGP